MADGSLWRQATDNFWQNHNILSATWYISSKVRTNASIHYTHGYGYYNELRPNNKLSKFGIQNFTSSDGSTVKRTDFIRKKGLKQDTYGIVWNASYKDDHWDVISGINLQQFKGNHFGYITYISNKELSQKLLANGKYQYYDSDADKGDYSGYLKGSYKILKNLSIFGDVQYRHVNYNTDGINDKFYSNDDGTYNIQVYNTNGCHIYYITVGDGDEPPVTEAKKIAYLSANLHHSDAADYAFAFISGDSRFDVTEIDVAVTQPTVAELQEYDAVVISPTI